MDNQEFLQALRTIVKEEIAANNAAILQPIDERFTKIDERFTKIDERFTKIEERITKIEILVENDIDKKLDLLGEGQLGMNEKFRQLDKLAEKVEDIQTTVEVLKFITVKNQ